MIEVKIRKTKTDEDYETIRRYLIVQMNKAGASKLSIANTLTQVRLKLSLHQRKAIARVIASGEYRNADIAHDIMGVLYDPHPEFFLPRIKEIQEVF